MRKRRASGDRPTRHDGVVDGRMDSYALIPFFSLALCLGLVVVTKAQRVLVDSAGSYSCQT